MKIDGEYLVLDKEYIKTKKITGHSFVGLLGYDNFSKVGDVLLQMHGIIKTEVDPKYLKRGDLAETIINRVYTREGHKCTTYDKQAIKYDNFQEYKNCGGLIDIELVDENTLIEVKSKSMKDYDYIVKSLPKSELYQALYYGFLRRYNKITMEYVFFDKETEDEVFNDKPITSLKNLKRFSSTHTVDRQEINDLIKQALAVVMRFRTEKRIPLSDISDSVLDTLHLQRPINTDEISL